MKLTERGSDYAAERAFGTPDSVNKERRLRTLLGLINTVRKCKSRESRKRHSVLWMSAPAWETCLWKAMHLDSLGRQDMDTGDGIQKGSGLWSFAEGVAPVFEEHARKSIPGYEEGHDLICKASDHFITVGSRCIDVGCSTGKLLQKLRDRHQEKSPTFIGIDIEPEMIEYAKKNNHRPNIHFELRDAIDQSYENCDLVIMNYVLQFIRPRVRQEVLNQIWNQLNWGGALFLFEKVRGSDSRFNDILTSCYWEFKAEQGFSDSEIISKWRSLRGILEPFTEAGNLGLLQRAGWTDIETIWKWGPFQGFLAIK